MPTRRDLLIAVGVFAGLAAMTLTMVFLEKRSTRIDSERYESERRARYAANAQQLRPGMSEWEATQVMRGPHDSEQLFTSSPGVDARLVRHYRGGSATVVLEFDLQRKLVRWAVTPN